jgi:DNA-binding Lrp family transcriptional regulator
LDTKDFQLLAALHKDARQSYQSLGRSVSLSAPAVRERVKRLEGNGVLHGYGLWIDPSVLGLMEVLAFFCRERTREEVAKVLAHPDVAWIGWKLEGGLTVGLWSRDTDRSIEKLATMMDEKPFERALTGHRDFAPLTLLDWTVIDALVDDPTVAFSELVYSTDLSPKTIRKRLENLFESEVIFIMPRQGAAEGSGEVVYHLAVVGNATVSEVRKIIPDTVLLHETKQPPMKYLLCRSTDLGEVTAKTHALRALPGIQEVRLTLNQDLLFSTKLEHRLVREQIRVLERKGKR